MATLRAIYTGGVSGTYFRVINAAGQFWNGTAFEAYNAGNQNAYKVTATETVSGSGIYQATTPAVGSGLYSVEYFDPASSSDPLAAFEQALSGTTEITATNPADSAGVTTALARIGAFTGTGLNTILGCLRALAAKAAGLTPSDLSSGTTFDGTTDSQEAIRDRGDAAYTGTVTILPVTSTVGTGEVKGNRVWAYQYAGFDYQFTILDSQGEPIDCTGHTLKFVVYDRDDAGTWLWQETNCVVSGTDGNIVTVTADDTNTDDAGVFRYALRDMTTDRVLARGELVIDVTADAQ